MVKLKVILIVCRQIPRVKRSIAELLALSMSIADTHTQFFLTLYCMFFHLCPRSPLLFESTMVHVCARTVVPEESVASWLIGLTRLVSACG